ncbi:MAG: cytochrome c [Fimbriimonadales bacterium]|nr:cytochrome c [Fimbriimonadales bacterium]
MRARQWLIAGLLGATALGLTGCRTDMWVQQKVEAQDSSEFYALTDPVQGFDGKIYGDGSRPMPENTIARGKLNDPNDPFLTGKDAQGNLLTKLPPQVKLSRELLNKGQEKFNAFCANCHGRAGDGMGMIALRGQWPRPVPSLVRQQLHTQPIAYFFNAGKYGFGIMYPLYPQLKEEELWAIAAYIRVLQLSQNADIKTLPQEDLEKLAQAEMARKQRQQQLNTAQEN